MDEADRLLSLLPTPDAVSFGGLKPGEVPFVTLTYRLGKNDEALERLLGTAFGDAKAQSTDGTVKVRVE